MSKHSTIGRRLRKARRTIGMSQTAIAERIGVSKQQVCHWEKDRCDISAGQIGYFARACGVTTDWLIYG